jgi:hypothetical protein
MDSSVFQTIIAGVSVFVLGQFVVKLVLDPLVRFREALGHVSAVFVENQSKITNANGSDELSQEIKLASARLISLRQAVPLYGAVAFMSRLPSKSALLEGCRSLNFIASSILEPENGDDAPASIDAEMTKLQQSLKITVRYGQ